MLWGCFEELVLLEVPVREETSKLKSRGQWCWVRTSSWGRVSAEQSRGPPCLWSQRHAGGTLPLDKVILPCLRKWQSKGGNKRAHSYH